MQRGPQNQIENRANEGLRVAGQCHELLSLKDAEAPVAKMMGTEGTAPIIKKTLKKKKRKMMKKKASILDLTVVPTEKPPVAADMVAATEQSRSSSASFFKSCVFENVQM